MSKQGQHNDDQHDYDKSPGPNKHDKSVNMATGTPKKQETYAAQARRHEDPAGSGSAASNDWNEDTRDKPSIEDSPRARDSDISSGRSGSDSNESKGTQGH